MAEFDRERAKDFKQSVDTKRMFSKSDDRLAGDVPSATAISSSDYNKYSASFAAGDHLLDDGVRENMGPFMYVIDTLQGDIEDIHAEVSTSMYDSTVGTYLKYDTGSFLRISSSLTPDADNTYDLGSSGNEWKNLYLDGTANLDRADIGVVGTDLIPVTPAGKFGGQSIGSAKARWSRIFLASHIDVSGSELVISSPSASVAGDEFNVIISGSIVPGDTASGSIGTIDAPFKDLYVQSSSIFFADMSDHGGKSWKQMTKSERLSRTTTFHKDDIDKMKQGKSLNDSGDIKAEGNLEVDGESTLTGQTRIKGKTIIEGITELSGSVSAVGHMDIRGGFKVNGTSINNLEESLDYSNSLRATGVTTAEFDKLDGLTATTAELNKMDGVTSTTAELNILDGVTSTAAELNIMDGVTATTAELNYTDGVTSAIQTQLNAELNTAGGTATGIIQQPYALTDTAAINKNNYVVDCRAVSVLQIVSGGKNQLIRLDNCTPSYRGQELTIICMVAGTITHTTPAKTSPAGIFVIPNGQSLVVSANTVVKFVSNFMRHWYQVV